jgi:hypothetical protein
VVGHGAEAACAMNKAVLRSLCLLVLVASMAVRFQASRARDAMMTDFDVGAAVTEVIRQHGYVVRENPVKPPKVLSAVIYFQRPGCDQASLVMPYFINSETLPLLARVARPDFDRHFFYLDRSWNEEARVPMFFEWAKFAVLDIFGASQYIPVKKAIVLAEAPDCRPAAPIDWQSVWNKDRSRNAAKVSSRGAPAHSGS